MVSVQEVRTKCASVSKGCGGARDENGWTSHREERHFFQIDCCLSLCHVEHVYICDFSSVVLLSVRRTLALDSSFGCFVIELGLQLHGFGA